MADFLEAVDGRGVATLTLNRPERHNAFDDGLISGLTEALERLGAAARVRAVVLASTGASFSAGADLGWMRRMAGYSEAENLADAEGLARLLFVLDRLPKPTCAVVQGNAFGGGVGLVACCDMVVASGAARFGLTEVRLGLTPATISPYVLAAMGARQARRYFLSGELFSAVRAQALGLVHEVVSPEDLAAARDRWVDGVLMGAPGAQAAAKDLVFFCEGRPVDEALRAATAARIAGRRVSAEGREGVAAFLEKREPAWRRLPRR